MGRGIALAAAVSLLWLKKGAEGDSINLRYLHLDAWTKMRLIPPWGGRGLCLATQGCWVGSGKDQLPETQCSNCRAAGLSKGSETLPKKVQNHIQTSPPCLLHHSWLLRLRLQNLIRYLCLGLLALTGLIFPCWLTPGVLMTPANRNNNKDFCITRMDHKRGWIKEAECKARKAMGARPPTDDAHGDPMSQLIAFGALCHSNHCNLVLTTTSTSLWPLIGGCPFILWNNVTFCCSTAREMSLLQGVCWVPVFLPSFSWS